MVLGLGKTKLVGATAAAKPIDTVETFGLPTATATPVRSPRYKSNVQMDPSGRPILNQQKRGRGRPPGEEGRDNTR